MLVEGNKLLSVNNSDILNGTINIPKDVEIIVSNAFSGCTHLYNICIPNSVKKIEYNAFDECINLREIVLPMSIKFIFDNTFKSCTNIESIYFSSSLTDATDVIPNILNNNKNVKIYIYDKWYEHNNLIDIKSIRINEILDYMYVSLINNNYIYNYNKDDINNMYNTNENFRNIVNNIILNSRKEDFNYEDEITKFAILFSKTRFINLPSDTIFENLDINLCSKYNVKMMRNLKQIDVFNVTNFNCEKILINIISFFGLFEKDKDCYKRFAFLQKILSHRYQFNTTEYLDMNNDIKQYFIKVKSSCFLLNENVSIPSDYRDYLKRIMKPDDVKIIKKLKNRYGKLINDYFKQNYNKTFNDVYVLKDGILFDEIKIINNYILNSTLNNQVTYASLNEVFSNIPKGYNKDIFTFFLKNIDIIISKKEYRLKFKEIVERYDEIKYYYLAMGNDSFSYHDAYRYLCETIFFNVKKGNYEFEQMVKKAGVTRQCIFEKYQDLYEKIKNNNSSVIPRIKEEFNITIDNNKYTVEGEMLRKDDPFSLLVGELSYTDCCQRLDDNGNDCLIHAINDGRIFCTYLIDGNNKILLSQSWVWRNGNVICFDNIEGTSYMKKDVLYSRLVANAYKYISKKILEKSKSINDNISVIMVGYENNDLELIEKYFGVAKENQVLPCNYYSYHDSSKVYYICGSEEMIDTNYNIEKKYIDERLILNQTGMNITSKTIEKIGKMNLKYASIDFNTELSQMLGVSINDLSVIYGEDWYIIYKVVNNNLSIIDCKIKRILDNGELIIQKKELLNVCKVLLQRYNISTKGNEYIKELNK